MLELQPVFKLTLNRKKNFGNCPSEALADQLISLRVAVEAKYPEVWLAITNAG